MESTTHIKAVLLATQRDSPIEIDTICPRRSTGEVRTNDAPQHFQANAPVLLSLRPATLSSLVRGEWIRASGFADPPSGRVVYSKWKVTLCFGSPKFLLGA